MVFRNNLWILSYTLTLRAPVSEPQKGNHRKKGIKRAITTSYTAAIFFGMLLMGVLHYSNQAEEIHQFKKLNQWNSVTAERSYRVTNTDVQCKRRL